MKYVYVAEKSLLMSESELREFDLWLFECCGLKRDNMTPSQITAAYAQWQNELWAIFETLDESLPFT